MPRTAKQILMSQGYTEADLAGMNTMLSDARFCGVLEAQDAEREKAVKSKEDYDTWFNEKALPENLAVNKALAESRAREASMRELYKQAKDRGLSLQAIEAGFEPEVVPPAGGGGNQPTVLDSSKFVSLETFGDAYAKTGDAIALANDLAWEHRELFGTRLNTRELLADARSQKKSIDQVWETKYNVPGKRAEIAASQAKAHDDKIREEERARMASEYGNPALRAPVDSRSPFTRENKPPSQATQPWMQSAEQNSQARVARVLTKVLQ